MSEWWSVSGDVAGSIFKTRSRASISSAEYDANGQKYMKNTGAIALGGNLPFGEAIPKYNILRALQRASDFGMHVKDASSIWQTPCFPAGTGPDFANAAAVVEFDGTAAELLEICHKIEGEFGRTREARWSARTLDVDLLFFGDQVLPDIETVRGWIKTPNEVSQRHAPGELILPHPRIQDRGFVLVPLAEVTPDWKHPILGRTVLEMRNRLSAQEIEAIQVISARDPAN